MDLLKPLRVPEYLFRPHQVWVRLARALTRHVPEEDCVRLPWGERLWVCPRENIGATIWYYGVFDLVVAEALCRLLDPGELALDVGANIGQMTSLMRHRAGPRGRVLAFEPHPQLFRELRRNMAIRDGRSRRAEVEVHELALSDVDAELTLEIRNDWALNRGRARIGAGDVASGVRVRAARLDHVLEGTVPVGVCKIDVEGHELSVLRGAQALVGRRAIRDIVFEELGTFPSGAQTFLLEHGYSLFELHSGILRPHLEPAPARPTRRNPRDGSNCLATLDSRRAQRRFQPWGWMALNPFVVGL